jgi:hypothetical protein
VVLAGACHCTPQPDLHWSRVGQAHNRGSKGAGNTTPDGAGFGGDHKSAIASHTTPFRIFDSLRSRGGIGLAKPRKSLGSSESSRENAWAGASLAVERAGHMAASSWATLLSSPQSPNSAWDLLLSERNASSTASSLAASDEVEPTLSDWDRFAGAELISSPSLSRKASKEQCDARKPGDGSCTPAASPARR